MVHRRPLTYMHIVSYAERVSVKVERASVLAPGRARAPNGDAIGCLEQNLCYWPAAKLTRRNCTGELYYQLYLCIPLEGNGSELWCKRCFLLNFM